MPAKILEDGPDAPTAKRSRIEGPRGSSTARLFAPYRTIGLISTDIPFTTHPLGKTNFQITTSVSKSLQTYSIRGGLQLVFLTRPSTPEPITATVAWKDFVLAAWGGEDAGSVGVWVFKRGKKVAELEIIPGAKGRINQLLVFGSWIVGCCSNQIHVWKSASYEYYTTLTPTGSREDGVLSGGICTLPTFLNKIIAGRRDGSIEIWNVSTGKLVYTILPFSPKCGAVTALQPAPALAVLAIAYENGSLVLHNVRNDQRLLQLHCGASSGSICSISFRTDGLGAGEDGRSAGVMATCGKHTGDVHFWDLNEGGRLMGVLRGAHAPPKSSADGNVGGGINKVEFLAGQPVVVTGGLDNSIKTWIFDETPFTPVPRILHSRSGHAGPITKLTFVPSDADGAEAGNKWLLTAAKDRSLFAWSLRRDNQSGELSQGNIRKKAKKAGLLSTASMASNPNSNNTLEDLKAPEITCMAVCLNKDPGMGAALNPASIWSNGQKKGKHAGTEMAGYESIVTGHNDRWARSWRFGQRRAGMFKFETSDGGNVRSVAITACGTFALVGSSSGSIDMFNLQSGIRRQRFPAKVKSTQAKPPSGARDAHRSYGLGEGKHHGAVTGLATDALNRTVMSIGLDGILKFWDFSTGLLQHELSFLLTSITAMKFHSPNDLVAFSCEDFAIRVVDIETRRLVRELKGSDEINDFCFSSDGRWIIAASSDSAIRVWDLPTGQLIDAFRVESPCTGLACSNSGEYLATSHMGSIGVNLWVNRTLFTHVPLRPISNGELAEIHNPTVSGEGGSSLIEAAYDNGGDDDDAAVDGFHTSAEQLSRDLTSLSLAPRSRWQTLLQLDLIRERNKPKEPPKAPERAPFFLPSLGASSQDPLISAQTEQRGDGERLSIAERSRIMKMARERGGTGRLFTRLLHEGYQSGNFDPFIDNLKSLSPSSADLEIRSLSSSTSLLLPHHPPSSTMATVAGTTADANNNLRNNDGMEIRRTSKTIDERTLFIKALTSKLKEKRDYELVQAWMNVFLKLHGDDLLMITSRNGRESDGGGEYGQGDEQGDEDEGGGGVLAALKEWKMEQEKEGKRLTALTGYCSGVLRYLRRSN
ncbi:MAG: hypothetical protein M1823_001329 [Watsoniomyces obsoletus]|nr:MAG: hypothetical protein M1823_001329 [Watsoniomyces obsoletus]